MLKDIITEKDFGLIFWTEQRVKPNYMQIFLQTFIVGLEQVLVLEELDTIML